MAEESSQVAAVSPMEFEVPRLWRSAAELPDDVGRVRDHFGRIWERQFLPLADGTPQWRRAGAESRFGGPIPATVFPVREA